MGERLILQLAMEAHVIRLSRLAGIETELRAGSDKSIGEQAGAVVGHDALDPNTKALVVGNGPLGSGTGRHSCCTLRPHEQPIETSQLVIIGLLFARAAR
jgi:hypothetical protein